MPRAIQLKDVRVSLEGEFEDIVRLERPWGEAFVTIYQLSHVDDSIVVSESGVTWGDIKRALGYTARRRAVRVPHDSGIFRLG